MRTILHCDLNNFFASVECLKNPELNSVPIAVCGSVEERRGIVLAKNDLAKAMGVTTGEAIWQAKQTCHRITSYHVCYTKVVRKGMFLFLSILT